MIYRIRRKLSKIINMISRAAQKQPRLKFVYAWYYKHLPVNEHLVLFESFHGKDVSDSPLYILREFLKMEESAECQIYFATNDYRQHIKIVEAMRLPVKLVDINTYKYTKILATAKYLVNNSSFPVYFIRREEQIYLQTWHGTPLKTLGKRMRLGIESMYNVQHNFLQASYIMFPNEFTRNVMMEDYNLNSLYTGKVVMCGYPRNSIFMDQERAELVRRQLGNAEYTTLAYMPTWRGQSNHDIRTDSYGKEINDMLKYLDKNMPDHQKLYVNFHPVVQKEVKLDNFKHICSFPEGVDKYEFLNSVDALITDYSSVFFDYSVTRKPIILFTYDYEEYLKDRGVYFDIRELPFRKVYTIEELKDCLVSEEFRRDSYADDPNYIDKYIQYDSIDAGRKMADLVFNGETSDMPVTDYSDNRKKRWNILWPEHVNSPEAIDAVAGAVNRDTDIVIFERRYFNPSLSSYLYDNYRDDFEYLFLTKTLPRTFLEEVIRRYSATLREELHKREMRRCFVNLDVNPCYCKTSYSGKQGERFSLKNVPTADVHFSVEGGVMCIDCRECDLQAQKILLINGGNIITWIRELSGDEKNTGIIREDLKEVIDRQELVKNKNYQLALQVTDKNGRPVLNYIKDQTYYQKALPKVTEQNNLALRYPSIYREDCYLKGMEAPVYAAFTPYCNKNNGRIYLHVCLEQDVENYFIKVWVKKIRTHGSTLKLSLLMPQTEYHLEEVRFKLRNDIKLMSYSLPYEVKMDDECMHVSICVDMNQLELQPQYWDLDLVIEKDGRRALLGCYTHRRQRLMFTLGNYQCKVGDKYIIFPYRRRLGFSFRERCPYDGWDTKLKEYAALAVYALLYPYWKKKRIWLVYEKFCIAAQENGYYFFRYCMENLSREERSHIFYILDKNSPDRERVEKYKDQVLDYMSFRYMVYCLAARIYIAPDSRKHLYIWRAKPNPISTMIERRDILFLQHGVTALKRVHTLFGVNSSSNVTYFVTTSRFEQDIIVKYFGYTREEAPILGFARWDVLEDTSTPEDKMILVMPSWRLWLEESSSEEFKQSEYYHNYMSLLQSERLKKILDVNQVRLIFFIHPKLKDYLSEFHADRENVELIPFGSQPLNELIKHCSMLITDYSSVCWDAYYLEKPVLFYQFDSDKYIKAHGGSYMNFETELFGDRYVEGDALIDGIEKYVQNGFQENPKYADVRDYYFEYRDNDNSKRIYEYIVKKGY